MQLDCLSEQKEFDIKSSLEDMTASSWDNGGIQIVKQNCALKKKKGTIMLGFRQKKKLNIKSQYNEGEVRKD